MLLHVRHAFILPGAACKSQSKALKWTVGTKTGKGTFLADGSVSVGATALPATGGSVCVDTAGESV